MVTEVRGRYYYIMQWTFLPKDMTTAINIFLQQALIRKGLLFEISIGGADPVLLQKLLEADNDKDILGPLL
ncbi:hypothetical protein SELR_pSRC500050 (plasmid) [Selenomonas ruminantium subsp. lactilytica TAM6421]|uniref:Uncharacterized protein n=1 Tax=Selenomonas ruminantium subsp. lactilytica (strain NBRC 103574 / TAM6421) TaxID=927704 RepID=I0GWP2_SELRL|nr:hypothetical protein [Selenomonas ruminantium]BAL85179.1 hypothetical protein SELR_pSRC500050 [Selenomonas ruminantium subsp. lactilytica TAM6421]